MAKVNIKTMHPLKLRIAPPSKSKLHPPFRVSIKITVLCQQGRAPAPNHAVLLCGAIFLYSLNKLLFINQTLYRRGGRSTLRHFLSPYKDTAEVFCMATLLCRGVPLHPNRFTLCKAVFYCLTTIQKKTCNANIGNTRFHINAHV